MTQQTNNKDNQITLEQTVQKVKELNKEVKDILELLHSIVMQVDKTYGYIEQIGDILGTAKVEEIPNDKFEKIETYKDKVMAGAIIKESKW